MESQSGAIIAAGYKQQTAEYIKAKVNSSTGMLGGLTYNAMSGSLKAMWAFGKDINGEEIYIKIGLGRPNNSTVCVSFHKPDYPIQYQFK
jgi:hypothetical protein